MSQSSKTRITKEFQMSFELVPKVTKGKKGKLSISDQTFFDFFVKHFGEIQVAPRYRMTVEVVK